MTIPNDLLTQIRATLSAAVTPNLTTASNTSDIFEAYVFSLVLEAAGIEGATISYRDVFGNIPSTFIFRTSPGYIFSTRQAYSHAVIQFDNKPALEAHVGVRIVGRSGVLHECDVAVIEHVEAETCRQRQVPPRSAKVLIAVECKFYSTPLQLNLARSFIGLTSDLSGTNKQIFATNNASQSLEKLLSARKKIWEHNLIPNSEVKVLRLRHKFQDAFQDFKAKR